MEQVFSHRTSQICQYANTYMNLKEKDMACNISKMYVCSETLFSTLPFETALWNDQTSGHLIWVVTQVTACIRLLLRLMGLFLPPWPNSWLPEMNTHKVI